MVNVHEAKKKNKAMKSQELSVLRASLGKLWNSLTVADGKRMMVKEGNKQLKQLLTLKNCTKWNYTIWNWDGSETNSRAWSGSESFEKEDKRNRRNKKVNVLQMIINILISLSYKGLSCLNTWNKGKFLGVRYLTNFFLPPYENQWVHSKPMCTSLWTNWLKFHF